MLLSYPAFAHNATRSRRPARLCYWPSIFCSFLVPSAAFSPPCLRFYSFLFHWLYPHARSCPSTWYSASPPPSLLLTAPTSVYRRSRLRLLLVTPTLLLVSLSCGVPASPLSSTRPSPARSAFTVRARPRVSEVRLHLCGVTPLPWLFTPTIADAPAFCPRIDSLWRPSGSHAHARANLHTHASLQTHASLHAYSTPHVCSSVLGLLCFYV